MGCWLSGCVLFAWMSFYGVCHASESWFEPLSRDLFQFEDGRVSLCCVSGSGLLFLLTLGARWNETPHPSGCLVVQYGGIVDVWNANRKSSCGRGRKLVAWSLALWSFLSLSSFFLAHLPFPILETSCLRSPLLPGLRIPSSPRERTDTHIRKVDSLPIVAGRDGSSDGRTPQDHEYAHNR